LFRTVACGRVQRITLIDGDEAIALRAQESGREWGQDDPKDVAKRAFCARSQRKRRRVAGHEGRIDPSSSGPAIRTDELDWTSGVPTRRSRRRVGSSILGCNWNSTVP
jgi:hypothetical protein